MRLDRLVQADERRRGVVGFGAPLGDPPLHGGQDLGDGRVVIPRRHLGLQRSDEVAGGP